MSLNRREFLRVSTAAALTLPVPGAEPPAVPGSSGELPRRLLGKTGQPVTILGLGGAWIAWDRTARDHRASELQTRELIEAALAGGIRYFDTAPNYDRSEERLGPALAPVRDQIFLVTKLDHPDAKSAEQDLAASLKLLRTDHVDLLLLHGLGLETFEDLTALKAAEGALTFLRRAKERGQTRFIGFSSHPVRMSAQRQFALAAEVDVIQPFINYIARHQYRTEEILVEFARQHGIGVTAMKVLGGDGQLADDYERAFRYALSVPGVHCALIGASSVAEVNRAVAAARSFRPLTATELHETIELGRKLFESNSRKSAQLHRHLGCDTGVRC